MSHTITPMWMSTRAMEFTLRHNPKQRDQIPNILKNSVNVEAN